MRSIIFPEANHRKKNTFKGPRSLQEPFCQIGYFLKQKMHLDCGKDHQFDLSCKTSIAVASIFHIQRCSGVKFFKKYNNFIVRRARRLQDCQGAYHHALVGFSFLSLCILCESLLFCKTGLFKVLFLRCWVIYLSGSYFSAQLNY